MKIIGICGSPRKHKSTYYTLNAALEAAKEANPDIETEVFDLADKTVAGCTDCDVCRKKLDCSINDNFKELIPKLQDTDLAAVIIATPVYMGCMSGQVKALLDRSVMFRRNGFLLKDKIGAALAVGGSRNGGQELAIQAIHAGMLIHDMIIVGDGEKTAHFGGITKSRPDIEEDETGLLTVRNTGKRVAELAAKIF